MYLYLSPLSKLPIQTICICGYLEPLSAVLCSALLFHKTMLSLQKMGAIFILVDSIFAECGDSLKQKTVASLLIKLYS